MSRHTPPSSDPRGTVVLDHVSFSWPDGTPVLDDVTVTLPTGRVGLVGSNGAGKSTLLALLTGDLAPTSGTVAVPGTPALLEQDVTRDPDRTVAEILGIAPVRAALARIESGTGTPDDFDRVGDRWDIDEQAHATLSRVGLAHLVEHAPTGGDAVDVLDRTVRTLSGGEAVLVALTALLLAPGAADATPLLLLDEPTENLDVRARATLHDALGSLPGTVLVASHDRALLDDVDAIVELRDHTLRIFGGGYGDYRDQVDAEQESARAAVRDAKAHADRQARELVENRTKAARRLRYGKKMEATKREPKIVMGLRKRAAQESAGKVAGRHEENLESARAALDEARQAVRTDRAIRLDLPETEVPGGRWVARGPLDIVGPERIAIVGPNGSGKTTLLRAVVDEAPLVPYSVLPQRLRFEDESESVVGNARRAAPHRSDQEIRALLARMELRGRAGDTIAGSLSGGQRVRAALAVALAADPPPQLLILDEPTNNLDVSSLGQLADALRGFRGALVVVSHDERFLDDLGIDRYVTLDR